MRRFLAGLVKRALRPLGLEVHGYRGVRHDVSSGLQVPFQRGFAMEGVFTLSSYDEEGQSSLPFLLGLNLVYEF